MVTIRFTGKVPSKKNKWRRRAQGGIGVDRDTQMRIDELTAEAYLAWHRTIRFGDWPSPLEHPGMVWRFGISNFGQDQDNIVTTLLDCLVKAGVLKDDNFAHCNGKKELEPAVRVPKGDEWVEVDLWT